MKYYWGAVLIGLGIVVIAFDPFDKLDAYLHGVRNTVLTAILLGLAALTAIMALTARPTLKALLILWIVAP
jgi:amino acid transporter